jgi:hypothetical protein
VRDSRDPGQVRAGCGFTLSAIVGLFLLGALAETASAGDHKKLVPLAPYPGTVGYAPIAPYGYTGAVGNAPLVYGNAPTAGYYQTALAPTTTIIYGNAPAQGYAPYGTVGYANAPVYGGYANAPVNNGYGNAPGTLPTPAQVSTSRVTFEGLKDIFEDLYKIDYEAIKTEDKTQVGRRSKLITAAKEKYVLVLGDAVTGVDDLSKPENQEIQGLVDLVMKTDANAANPNATNNNPNFGYAPYGAGAGFAPATVYAPAAQPLYYYYYPVVPVKKHQHKPHNP